MRFPLTIGDSKIEEPHSLLQSTFTYFFFTVPFRISSSLPKSRKSTLVPWSCHSYDLLPSAHLDCLNPPGSLSTLAAMFHPFQFQSHLPGYHRARCLKANSYCSVTFCIFSVLLQNDIISRCNSIYSLKYSKLIILFSVSLCWKLIPETKDSSVLISFQITGALDCCVSPWRHWFHAASPLPIACMPHSFYSLNILVPIYEQKAVFQHELNFLIA